MPSSRPDAAWPCAGGLWCTDSVGYSELPVKISRTNRRKPSAPAGETNESAEGASIPIVGVGASAGGLEAFTELLKHLPLDTGMGFVLVQHLDPQHESVLTQLLGRATSMPVREVTNNLKVEPNRVYVIPPNTNLGVVRGVLKLQPRAQTRAPHRSIDFFFESLAHDQRERAIGVILSGTATDGTLGLEAIKAEGGITFAQDDTARYDSMPRSAAAAGCVDFVLSPEKIATEIARIAKHPYVARYPTGLATEDDRASATAHEDDETPLPSGGRGTPRTGAMRARAEAARGRATTGKSAQNGFKRILLLLRKHSGVDFSLYKSTTIQRRIARRMVLNKQDTPEHYADFLGGNTGERDALYTDVLISVTSFFRNPEAFDVLSRKVFPKLLQSRTDDPLRVWVVGCSTGQEAYSIAMTFLECADKAPRMRKLQVFATDLNDALLDKARHGLYAKSLANDIAPDRLRRFFVDEEGGYRVSKPLREMVVFARQNLIDDPPFSRMDLISCRNLLIYLEPSLQKKAIATFHYALKPEGFLFLGASESIGTYTDLFGPADKKHKIYSKKAAPTPAFHLPARNARAEQPSMRPRPRPALPARLGEAPEGFRAELDAQREADRLTVSQFAPPSVLINADLQIVQFRGPTAAYLEPPTGKATFDVLKMARAGLMLPLRAAINKAKKDNRTVRKENVRIERDGDIQTVNVQVVPLKNLKERCFLVLFEDAPDAGGRGAGAPSRRLPDDATKGPRAVSKKEESRRIVELETDLAETRDYVQTIQEQYEAANEELQAANEEVQSANEELQSVNEELETSKEELESANEELTTINEEMANRNAELNRLNSDLVNLQTSTRLAIVLVGRDLVVRRFSAQAEKQLNLVATDIGRPIGNVRNDLVFVPDAAGSMPDLETFVAGVIDTMRESEREVRDRAGHWYSLRVRPYLTLDNKVDGAVLVLVDIDGLKRSEQAVAAARDFAEAIVASVPDPLLILNPDLRVQTVNAAFYSTFRVAPAEAQGRLIYELGNRQWAIPKLRELLEDILPRNSSFDGFEITHDFETIGRRTMLLNARSLREASGDPPRIMLGIQDVTELLGYQAAARESAEKFKVLFERSPLPKYAYDLETLRFTDVNEAALEHYGYSREEFLRMSVLDICTPEAGGSLKAALARSPHHPPNEQTCTHRKKSGEIIDVEVNGTQVTLSGKRVWLTTINDITRRKKAEQALREAGERLRFMAESMPQKIFTAQPDGAVDYFNQRWIEYTGAPLQELRDWGWTKFIHPDDVAEYLRVWRHSLGTGEPFLAEHRIRRADGGYCWHLTRAVAFKDAARKIAMWIGSNTDIHEVKEADRHKDEFLALLAHELRGPLAPLSNMLEVIKRVDGNDELFQRARSTMERQLAQMTRLIDDLLDVNRISRGRLELRREPIELACVVNHAVEACRAAMDQCRHELTVSLPPQPVYVDGDRARLAQMFANLLTNACKYSEPGTPISLTVEQQDEDVIVSVKDSGIGIAPDMLPKIFSMFMQVDRSSQRSQGGLGIGLTLVRQLAEMHGGSITASSEGLGRGSEFVVSLPALHGKPQLESRDSTSSAPASIARRILVVDDNKDAADSIATLLKMDGHETHTVNDGLAAVEAAATFGPDVILCDIGLPKTSGYEVARRIREQPWGKAIVLIAVTGWGQDEDRRKSKEVGFDAHLVKPVEHAALLKLLAELR